MNRKTKIVGIALIAILCYYGFQYASTAIHYNCQVIKDDCVPPINLTGELIYRLIHPSWLNQFENEPMTFFFKDGRFSFWEGEVAGKAVVIRVRENESPVMLWLAEGLPSGITIRPANGEHVKEWLASHPEYELSR